MVDKTENLKETEVLLEQLLGGRVGKHGLSEVALDGHVWTNESSPRNGIQFVIKTYKYRYLYLSSCVCSEWTNMSAPTIGKEDTEPY